MPPAKGQRISKNVQITDRRHQGDGAPQRDLNSGIMKNFDAESPDITNERPLEPKELSVQGIIGSEDSVASREPGRISQFVNWILRRDAAQSGDEFTDVRRTSGAELIQSRRVDAYLHRRRLGYFRSAGPQIDVTSSMLSV